MKPKFVKDVGVGGSVSSAALDAALEKYGTVPPYLIRYEGAYGIDITGLPYAKSGDFDHAIADLNRAITLDCTDATAMFNRGRWYYAKRDYARAREDWLEVIKWSTDEALVKRTRMALYWLHEQEKHQP